MDQDFGVALDPLVELDICVRHCVDAYLVTYHEARFGLSSNDEVSQVAVVCLDVALSGGQVKSLL